MSSEIARDYFEFVANLGMTKHYGSMEATRELVELCRISNGQYVLDVGCGVGATPCYLAKAVDCRVMGVDLVDKMIEQSRERAKAHGVEDRVEFRVADARSREKGIIGSLLIEGAIEDDTEFDKASVTITDKTGIFQQEGRVRLA